MPYADPVVRAAYLRRWREEHREQQIEWRKGRKKQRRAAHARWYRKYVAENGGPPPSCRWPEQTEAMQRARRMVRNALRRGELRRPSICSACGQEAAIEAAHADYSRPLDVRWLCRSCHRKWDHAEPKGGAIKPARLGRST